MENNEESLLIKYGIRPPREPFPVNHARDVHILSWAFLLIFLAFGAAQNLQSTINIDGNLGTISLGLLYSSFTCFSVIASVVVRNLGPKYALILGTSGYWLFIAANLLPTWYTMVPASLYLGFAASVIWVAQGTYLTSAASSHAYDYHLPEGTVIGKCNGEFWGMFASHQLVGNLITLAMLRDGKGGSTTGTTPLFIVFLCVCSVGTILMWFLNNRKSQEEEEGLGEDPEGFYSSIISLAKASGSLLLNKRVVLVIPLILFSGLQQAFVWADFTKHIVKPKLGERGVGGVMAVYGTVDAICSLIAGRFTTGHRSITVIVSGGVAIEAIAFLLLLLKYSMSGVLQVLFPVLIACCLGIGNAVLNTQISAMFGIFFFKHNLEGAFAQFKLWQSLSIAVVFFISPHVGFHVMLMIMLPSICISLIAFLFLTLKVEGAFSNPV